MFASSRVFLGKKTQAAKASWTSLMGARSGSLAPKGSDSIGFPTSCSHRWVLQGTWGSPQLGQDSILARRAPLHLHEPLAQDGRNLPVKAVSK